MTCPICDKKAANCDCTKLERDLTEEVSELERLISIYLERINSTDKAYSELYQRAEAAEARVKELEQMRLPCNQTTGMDYANEALERGIREGWEAARDVGYGYGGLKWAILDDYLKERKKL